MQYPENSGYMVAAYVMTAVIVVGYAVALSVRIWREKTRTGSGG